MAEKDEMDLRQDNPGRAWYVIHTYSGYENKVKANLERLIHTANMGNMIFNVVVPVEDEVEIKDGKKKVVPRKVFPGYVLVDMIVDEHSWYVVRNTTGVTGFVGSEKHPIPLTDAEAKRILKSMGEEEEHNLNSMLQSGMSFASTRVSSRITRARFPRSIRKKRASRSSSKRRRLSLVSIRSKRFERNHHSIIFRR